jgi:hypothetical protein
MMQPPHSGTLVDDYDEKAHDMKACKEGKKEGRKERNGRKKYNKERIDTRTKKRPRKEKMGKCQIVKMHLLTWWCHID